MLFNSFPFLLLLCAAGILYYLPPLRRLQVPVLIAAGMVFYSYQNPALTLVLLGVIAVNTAASFLVARTSGTAKRASAAAGIAASLGLLAFFKYSGFLVNTFADAKHTPAEWLISVPLPLGISFYVFKGISLVVDSFRSDLGDDPAAPVSAPAFFSRALLYMSFFPQLLSGPIERASDFMRQVSEKRFGDIDWERVIKLLVLGYFLKNVIADNLKDQTFWMSYPSFEGYSTVTLLAFVYGYSVQLFADFAGYSLIAIGIAAFFGYSTKDNFLFPYISRSFSEFWRRWHISLSSFLRDYLYIPLGGNRKGRARTYFNLIAVMFLGGLWHGAGWSYALWGTLHGLALAAERFLEKFPSLPRNRLTAAFRILFVFTAVSFLWIFFKLPDFSHVRKFLLALANNTGLDANPVLIFYIALYSLPVALYHLCYLWRESPLLLKMKRFEYIVYALLLFLVCTNSGTPNTFIYFQF